MATIITLNKMRKSETTNANVLVQAKQIKNDLFRVMASDNELNLLEVKEVENKALANLHFNYFFNRYSVCEKAQIIYDSGANHKFLYTNLELKGRGIAFLYKSDKGYNVYTATKLAFKKIRGQYSVKYAEQGVDVRSIA